MTVKIPISRLLTGQIILPFAAITTVQLFDLYKHGQQRFDQNITFLIVFGIPTLFLGWALLNKRTKFRETVKVASAQRLIRLPFSSFNCLFIFIISSFLMVDGLTTITRDKDLQGGLPILFLGTSIFILTAIAYQHPKIWFSDTHNVEYDMEKIKNTPKENYPMYQDGIFSYSDSGFTVKLENSTLTALWTDIKTIRAYKVDLVTVDSIVIEVQLDNTTFQITDEAPGHMKFMDTAANKLSAFKKDWFGVVAFPAFATNLTTIYERHNNAARQQPI
jgi:hypothetical protein